MKNEREKLNNTWLANPIPNPSKIRPTINIQTWLAKPLIRAPTRKSNPPKSMESFRPNLRVMVEATNEDKRAARYNDDVNIVNVWLSYWQYWFVDLSSFFFRYTAGKNFFRNGSMDVTPPDQTHSNKKQTLNTEKYHTIKISTKLYVYTWNSNIVAKDQTTHGSNDACYGDKRSEVSGVLFVTPSNGNSTTSHFFWPQ